MDIAGRAGLFLEGQVSPELEGVEISISERGAAAPLITVATNENGAYRYHSQSCGFKRTTPFSFLCEPNDTTDSYIDEK